MKKTPSLSLIVVLHLENILIRKDLNTNAWKNNSNHHAIFDDHNDEQVEEDKEDILYVLQPLYSQRKKTPSIACSSSPDYDSYKVPLSCYEQELVMMVVDDTVARLWL